MIPSPMLTFGVGSQYNSKANLASSPVLFLDIMFTNISDHDYNYLYVLCEHTSKFVLSAPSVSNTFYLYAA